MIEEICADVRAIYEQCPYDAEHVLGIYGDIPNVEDGGEWVHSDLPSTSRAYRIRAGYFQAIFSENSSCSIMSSLKEMGPAEVRDDAAWTVEAEDQGYSLSCVFTQTFGPTDAHERFDSVVAPHGIGLEDRGTYVIGKAFVAELNPVEFQGAIRRLKLLEQICIEANKQTVALLETYWDWYSQQFKDAVVFNEWLQQYGYSDGAKRRIRLPRIPEG